MSYSANSSPLAAYPAKQPRQSASSQSHILPHTTEAGDPYYIGDIYSRVFQKAKALSILIPDDSNSAPYFSHIKSLSQGWPDIQYLAEFMEVTTAPPKLKFLTLEDKIERASRTRVSMLDFKPQQKIERTDFVTIESLSRHLITPANGHDHVFARLFVVEDLSRDVIETFGARFDIDPLFFRGHISDYTWYNTRDPWVELPELDALCSKRCYTHLRYVQNRYFRTERSLKNAIRQLGAFNVLRRINSDGHWAPEYDEPGSDVGLVRSKASLWIRPNKDNEAGVLGILLVDPTIDEGFPLWGGYHNFNECPSMNTNPKGSPQGPPRTSTLEDVLYWMNLMTAEEIEAIPSDPRVFFRKLLMIICSEWLIMIKYATTRLTQIEWELEHHDFRLHAEGLDTSLKKLHPWRRRFPVNHSMVAEALEQVFYQQRFKSTSSNGRTNWLSDLQRDFEIVLAQLTALQTRAERIISVATAIISIEESKKAIQQNHNLTRLTYLAVVFVPLSWVSSLFSMSEDLSDLGRTFWTYFVVAIPLTVIALLMARYSFNISMIFERFKAWRRKST